MEPELVVPGYFATLTVASELVPFFGTGRIMLPTRWPPLPRMPVSASCAVLSTAKIDPLLGLREE
jgi:hypothetical protein